MGRYYDDKVSTAGLDPANPLFGPLKSSAEAIDDAESRFYRDRRDMFEELNFGSSVGSADDVEREYARLHKGLNVYEFRDEFDAVNPSRKSGSGTIRYVLATYERTTFASGFADLYVRGEEDDDGYSSFESTNDVLAYNRGAGKVQIDTLYDDVRAFTTGSITFDYFERDEDDDDGESFSPVLVNLGFGEVPRRWRAKGGYTSQDLQVMNIAGDAYESQVRPAIREYRENRRDYEANGGGPLVSDFYEGTPNFPYENFSGEENSYNRPQNLSAGLIDQARGFSS